jgi:pyruvate/2-oxoglutarate/acetoin dehydrogenase E1 component
MKRLQCTDVVLAVIMIAAVVVVFTAVATHAQQPPAQPAAPAPKVVTPKSPYDVRDAKIAVITEDDLQKTANALTADYQRQMADLQAKWKEQDVALKAWEADVRKANGWDDTYVFNQQTYEWAQQPKPAEKKPAEAPKK